MVPNAAEREYLQRRLGAALLGAPGLDDLIWLSGASGCGKGVSVAAWRAAFGEYAAVLPVSELIAGGHRGHPQWLAKLDGARILIADDVPPRALDVGVINRLLGSVLSAHHMRRGSFDFILTAPIIVTSNYPPQVDAADAGFRRRLRPIAAGPPIPEPDQDPTVRASMTTAAECAAVIRWLVDGARAFAADGCPVPDSIRQRTADVVSSTPLAEFVGTFPPGEWIESGELWRQWQVFKTGRGERPGGRRALTARLQTDHGWRPERAGHDRTRGWRVPAADAADACGHNESISLHGTATSVSCTDIDPLRPHASAPDGGDMPAGALDGFEGAPPPGRPAEIPDRLPPPAPADERPAETESGDPDRHNAILAAAEKLLGAPDMKAAAATQIREMAGKDRCRFCGGPPPLELTAPPACLMLCAECAATHREMTATTPVDLSARVDQHVGGKSIDELWTAAQETAVACIEREFPDAMRDVPSAERLARAAKIARGIH